MELPKRKDRACVINLDEYSDIGTHWVALYVHNNVTYFDSFGVEHIPKEIRTFIDRSLSITTNIFRIKAYDSMCGYFCIGFIDLMLEGKTLTEVKNLFSPNNLLKNDKKILNYFMTNIKKCNSIENDFHKTPNICPNLSTTPSNDQQFRLNKIN